MTKVIRSHQVVVHAPLRKAFDYVSDLTRHPEWSGGELKIEEVTPGPIAVGKEYRSRGEVVIQKDRPNTVKVSEYEPPRRFGFEARDPDFGQVTHVFTFQDQNKDIQITRTMTLNLNPLVAFAFHFFIYPFVGKPSMDKSMAALKKKLEQ